MTIVTIEGDGKVGCHGRHRLSRELKLALALSSNPGKRLISVGFQTVDTIVTVVMGGGGKSINLPEISGTGAALAACGAVTVGGEGWNRPEKG